jgi:dolichol-phosphate mannosyltransferase
LAAIRRWSPQLSEDVSLQEMGSRYLFILSYVWLERLLSRGDYQRQPKDGA